MVCVMFRGRNVVAACRVDLPTRHRDADHHAVADALISLACRTPGIDRVTPVIYTDSGFEGHHGIPWRDMAMFIAARIHRSGLHITGFICVAADGWGDYFEESPHTRHPLSEIANSSLASVGVPDLDALGSLPEWDPTESATLKQAIDSLTKLPDPLEWVEVCLATEPDLGDLAPLLALVQSPTNRDTMMLQVAFGRVVGEAVAEWNEHFVRLQEQTGRTMDGVVADEIAQGREGFDDEFDALLWGHGRIRPDVERIERAIAFLSRAVAQVEPDSMPAPLCMLAWLSWSLGRGSAAHRYLDLAIRIEPDYGMAQVLASLFGAGQVPQWAHPR